MFNNSENDKLQKVTAVEQSLVKFAGSLSIPEMRDAASLAFAIMRLVQDTKHKDDACMCLATDAFNYVCAICLLVEGMGEQDLHPNMAESIHALKMIVETIKKFAEAHLRHQPITTRLSLVLSGADVKEAQEHKEKLNEMADGFEPSLANIIETESRLARELLEGQHSHLDIAAGTSIMNER